MGKLRIAADAIQCDLADTMVRGENVPRLTLELEVCTDIVAMEACLRDYATQPPPGMTPEHRAWIDACFAASSVEEIMADLQAHPAVEAQASAEELMKMSPTSLKLTLRALRHARSVNDLAASLNQEFRLAQACEKGHDLVEGIRAAIVDKDRNPKWSPARLEDVTPDVVDAYFNDPDATSLDLPHP
jgi:enoyl-CoA hydratase